MSSLTTLCHKVRVSFLGWKLQTQKKSQIDRAFTFALTILAIYSCCCQFYKNSLLSIQETFDLGWLIQTGIYITQHGVPFKDIFSWTYPDRSFTAYQWLSELFIAVVYRLGGIWLLGLFGTVIASLIYFFFLPAMWIALGVRLPLIFGMLSFVLTPHFFNTRPQLASYLFLLLQIVILEKAKADWKKVSLFIPVLLIWVNVHSFWLIGMLISIIYILVQSRQIGARASLLLLLLMFCATVCNPYGLGLLLYLKTFVDGSQFLGMREVLPSWSDPSAFNWFVYFVSCVCVLIVGRRKVSRSGLIVCLVLSVMSVFVRRYQSVFVLVSWFYLGQALTQLKWAITVPVVSNKILQSLCLCLSILFASAVWQIRCPNEKEAARIFYENNESLLDWYNRLKPGRKCFSDPTSGSWLIAKGYQPVFIDTRYDMYPKDFCQRVLETLRGDQGWSDLFQEMDVSMVLIRNEFPIYSVLQEHPSWFPAVDNGSLSLWVVSAVTHPDLELKVWNIDNNSLRTTFAEEQQIAQCTATTRCRWYFKTSVKSSDQELAKQKLKDALILKPGLPILEKRLTELNQRK